MRFKTSYICHPPAVAHSHGLHILQKVTWPGRRLDRRSLSRHSGRDLAHRGGGRRLGPWRGSAGQYRGGQALQGTHWRTRVRSVLAYAEGVCLSKSARPRILLHVQVQILVSVMLPLIFVKVKCGTQAGRERPRAAQRVCARKEDPRKPGGARTELGNVPGQSTPHLHNFFCVRGQCDCTLCS